MQMFTQDIFPPFFFFFLKHSFTCIAGVSKTAARVINHSLQGRDGCATSSRLGTADGR